MRETSQKAFWMKNGSPWSGRYHERTRHAKATNVTGLGANHSFWGADLFRDSHVLSQNLNRIAVYTDWGSKIYKPTISDKCHTLIIQAIKDIWQFNIGKLITSSVRKRIWESSLRDLDHPAQSRSQTRKIKQKPASVPSIIGRHKGIPT